MLLLWLPIMLVVKTAAVEVGVNFPIRPQDQAWIDTLFYIPREPRVRREYRMLTEEQRNTFHQAFVALKNDTSVLPNKYDLLASLHARKETRSSAHRGTGFLGWHRVYTLIAENALREKAPNLTMPYWDCTLDAALSVPRDTSLFSEDFMGNGDGYVVTGAFKDWSVQQGRLYRTVGSIYAPLDGRNISRLLEQEHVSNISYPSAGKDMELIFEFIHNRVHHWIGGEMKIIETATDDPIFYPYHSFVSLVWAEFRALQRSLGIDPELDWDQFYGQSRHHKYSPLGLGNLFASDGSSDVFEENILFDERPWCNRDILDCGTPYLYCNVTVEKCVPWTADEYRLIKSKALKEDKAFKDIVFPFIESKLKKGFLELLAASGNQTTLSETAEYYITQHFEDPFEGIENASSGILVGDDLATKKPLNAWEVLVNEDEKTKKHEHDHKHSHNNGDMFRENSGDNGIAHNDRNDDHDHEGHDHAHGTQAVGDVVEQNERIVEVVSSGFEQFLMHYSIWILVALLIFRVILSIVTKCVSVYSTGWRCGRLKSKYSVSGGANLNDDANKMSTLALETSGNQVAESPRPDNIYTITVASKSADNSPTVYVRFAKYENEISQLNGPNVSRPRACVPVYKSEYEATTRPTETHGNYLDMTYTSRVSDEEPTSPIAEIYELEDRAEEEEGDIENMCNSLENDNYIRSVLQELDRATFRDDMQDIMEGYDNIMNVERHRKQLGAAVATLTPVPSPRAPLTDRFEGPQPCNMTSLNDETHATATFM